MAKPPSPSRRRVFSCLGIGLGLSLIWLLAIGGYIYYRLQQAQPSIPSVQIEIPTSGDSDELVVGNSALVHARSQDPDGIASAELWVNGHLVATEGNPNRETTFRMDQLWRPIEPGAYSIFVRAIDTQGYVGQSTTRVVTVVAKGAPAADSLSQVNVGEGDGEVAFAAPPLDNPPPSDSRHSGEDSPIPEVGMPAPLPDGGAPPRADAVRPPSICSIIPLCGDSADALDIPDWARDVCRALPGLLGCLGEILPRTALPNAPRVTARYAGACQIEIAWSDESADEIGFKVYRNSSTSELSLIGLTEHAGLFSDSPGAAGDYRYIIAAYNAAGETSSAPSELVSVPAADCVIPGSSLLAALDLEALTMTLSEDVERMYCYYSAGGSPYVRVPGDPALFMQLGEGGWNIADYAGGGHRLRISVPADGPLELAAQCFGWQGSNWIDLGSLSQAHPPQEWDGRVLTASSGQFTITYKIQPPLVETIEGEPMFIVDPSIPAPYNLTYGLFRTCSGGGMDPIACTFEEASGLQWNWELLPGDARRLVRFNVFFRLPGGHGSAPAEGSFSAIGSAISPRELYYQTSEMRAPSAYLMPCVVDINPGFIVPNETSFALSNEDLVVATQVFYSVQAVVSDPSTGYTLESPISEELEITLSGCPTILVIEMYALNWDRDHAAEWRSLGLNLVGVDHCDAADVYGLVDVEWTRVYWNAPYSEHPSRLRAPTGNGAVPAHTSQIGCRDANQLLFRNEALSQKSPDGAVSGFAYQNNLILAPMDAEGDELEVNFYLYDYDSGFNFGDDVWCAGHETLLRSPWTDASFPVFSGSTEYEGFSCHLFMNIYKLEPP